MVACGGWSKRRTLIGGDRAKRGADPLLDPGTETACIHAFFVDPDMARRGLGRRLMGASMAGARRAGFSALELVSTLPGEPLYRAFGFAVQQRFDIELPQGIRVPVAHMKLEIENSPAVVAHDVMRGWAGAEASSR